MKTLELEEIGVQEMDIGENKDTNGGKWVPGWYYVMAPCAALLVDYFIEGVSDGVNGTHDGFN